MPADSRPGRARDALAFSAGVAWTLLACASLLYLAFERTAYARLLNLGVVRLTHDEAWLLPTTVVGTTLLVLSPAWLVCTAAAWTGNLRVRRVVLGASVASGLAFLFVDLGLYASIGRHVRTVLAFARLPEGHRAAGDLGGWVSEGAQWAIAAALVSVAVLAASEGLAALARRSALGAALGLFSGGFVYAALSAIPVWWTVGWTNSALEERLFSALPWDARWKAAGGQHAHDAALETLRRRLEATYRQAFAFLYAPKAAESIRIPEGFHEPNVLFIVIESWRFDSLTPERMPRLSAWADRGLRLENHYCATNHSETGMFALTFGLNPLVYHATLDVPHDPVGRGAPQLCRWLRGAGYQCGYFTGHPEIWMRREEFLNATSMDVYAHDDHGDWPDWDRRALAALVERAHRHDPPIFGIALLMSTHFEYRYPPEYERHRPVATSRWLTTNLTALGASDELPHRNRYANALAFIDDAVADALERVNLDDTLVVIAGDHGESIFDDGRYGHGYSFADVISRTPCVLRGPGIVPGRRSDMTLHTDVPGIVLAALGARPAVPRHFHGGPPVTGEPRTETLLAYPSPSRDESDALLVAGGRRLRLELGLVHPEVRILGFEDARAHLLPTPPLTDAVVTAIDDAFRRQLDVASR